MGLEHCFELHYFSIIIGTFTNGFGPQRRQSTSLAYVFQIVDSKRCVVLGIRFFFLLPAKQRLANGLLLNYLKSSASGIRKVPEEFALKNIVAM